MWATDGQVVHAGAGDLVVAWPAKPMDKAHPPAIVGQVRSGKAGGDRQAELIEGQVAGDTRRGIEDHDRTRSAGQRRQVERPIDGRGVQTIVIAGQHIVGIRQFTLFYVRWRLRAIVYLMLLEDQYPPFGDAPYPASISVVDPVGPRDRLTVGFRLLLLIPHVLVLFFLLCAWWVTTIIAWFAILVTGSYPQGPYEFGVGVLRWFMRVEAYGLLLIDEYPPFSLT